MLRRATSTITLAGLAIVAAACTNVTAGTPVAVPTSVSNEPVELSFATFGDFGFEDLLDEYRSEHPTVTIKHENDPDGTAYQQKLETQFAANTVPDLVLVDESFLPNLADGDRFHDLAEVGPRDVTPDRWLDWNYEAGVAEDGTWVGYGVNIGPLAMAYRTDLFAAAGLGEPDGLFGSWADYFAAGQRYTQATGKPWFDHGEYLFRAMHDQLPTGFFDEDDDLAMESNVDIKANWDMLTAAIQQGQSAKFAPFTTEWNTGLGAGSFATTVAPYWLLNIIETQAGPANAGKWALAGTFPEEGGNWGGAYLTVPRASEHPGAAAELAAWLTAPEQRIRALDIPGMFPCQVDALASSELRATKNDYFAGPPSGRLYAGFATKVPTPHHKTRHDIPIHQQAIGPALQAVEDGTPPDQAWQQAVTTAKDIASG